jgi:hypothetical protein
MSVFALASERRWSCPRCPVTAVTHDEALPMHTCAGMRGLTAPLTEHGVLCKVEAIVREDYVGGEIVQTDGDGRPIAAVVTTRDDGQDCAVLAPCATVGVG